MRCHWVFQVNFNIQGTGEASSALKKYRILFDPIGIKHEIHWNSTLFLIPQPPSKWIWIFKIYQFSTKILRLGRRAGIFRGVLACSIRWNQGRHRLRYNERDLGWPKLVGWLVYVFFCWSSLQKCTKTNPPIIYSKVWNFYRTKFQLKKNTVIKGKQTHVSRTNAHDCPKEIAKSYVLR